MPRRPRPYPLCRSRDTVPIAYGYPGPEMQLAAEHGEIHLGGCCVTEGDPTWHCKACERDFGNQRG